LSTSKADDAEGDAGEREKREVVVDGDFIRGCVVFADVCIRVRLAVSVAIIAPIAVDALGE
jgi:hypothetical protein